MSQFDKDLLAFYENRSAYKYIKPDKSAQDWSIYVYGKDKKYTRTLACAVSIRDKLMGEI